MKKVLLLFFISAFISETTHAQNQMSLRLRNILSEYHHVGPVAENGLIMVCKKDTEHCGCIDTMGNEITPFIYGMNFFYFIKEQPQFNSVNRIVAAKPLTTMHAVYGVIDEKGNTVLPFEYETDYHNFHPLDAYHVFKTYQGHNSKEKQFYGVIDSLGNITIPFKYDKIEKAGDRSFIVRKNNKYGLLDINDKALLVLDYSKIVYDKALDLVYVENKGLWGAYTNNGGEIIPPYYESINSTVYGHIIIETYMGIEIFDTVGRLLKTISTDKPLLKTNIPNKITFPLILKQDGSWGAINASLKTSISFEYDTIYPAKLQDYYTSVAGIYHVKKAGFEAFIDTANNLLSSMWFDSVSYGGLVMKDSLWGWVNGQGELQIPVMYKNIKPILAHSSHIFDRKSDSINRNYFIITENEKVGLIDYNNKWVLNYDVGIQEIQSIYCPLNSKKVFIIAKKQDKVGAIDQSGKTVIPFEYDYAEADFTLFEHFKFGHYRFYKGKKRFLVDWDKGKLVKQ